MKVSVIDVMVDIIVILAYNYRHCPFSCASFFYVQPHSSNFHFPLYILIGPKEPLPYL